MIDKTYLLYKSPMRLSSLASNCVKNVGDNWRFFLPGRCWHVTFNVLINTDAESLIAHVLKAIFSCKSNQEGMLSSKRSTSTETGWEPTSNLAYLADIKHPIHQERSLAAIIPSDLVQLAAPKVNWESGQALNRRRLSTEPWSLAVFLKCVVVVLAVVFRANQTTERRWHAFSFQKEFVPSTTIYCEIREVSHTVENY